MRTIKFKAKNRICEWVKGDLLQYLDGTVYIGDNKGPWTDDGFHDSDYTRVEIVDQDTVCQFTGLLDKNGKEIYEGDILKVAGLGKKIEVRFVRGVFAFLWNGDLDDEAPINAPTQEWAEVVGNIHDNPKLIK